MKQEDFILLTYKNKGKHSGQIETLVQGKKQNPYNQIKWDLVVYTKLDYPLLYELFEKQYTPKNKYVITEKELENPIIFEDSTVKEIIVNRFGTDGEITFKQAAQVTNEQLEGLFNSNTTITKFNEFVFFTGITKISISDDSNLSKTNSPFYGCANLQEITLPETVTDLGYRAFNGCTSLTSITIPDSVTSIGEYAFRSCSGLTSINVNDGNTVYDSRNNCNAIIETETNTLIQGCNTTIIPDSVTSIGNTAFDSCTSLTSVTIPDSVTSIGSGVFQHCSSLTSVTIPDSVTSIGTHVFYQCYSLTSIVIPNGVTVIGQYAFYQCYNLTSVTIPDSVTSIDKSAFYNCTGLTSVIIPDSVTSIGTWVFQGCSGLTSCTIGNNVTSIADGAFADCTSLTSIVSNAMTAPTIQGRTFRNVKTGGTLTVPTGSTGYDVWMGTGNYYLGNYNWTKIEQ